MVVSQRVACGGAGSVRSSRMLPACAAGRRGTCALLGGLFQPRDFLCKHKGNFAFVCVLYLQNKYTHISGRGPSRKSRSRRATRALAPAAAGVCDDEQGAVIGRFVPGPAPRVARAAVLADHARNGGQCAAARSEATGRGCARPAPAARTARRVCIPIRTARGRQAPRVGVHRAGTEARPDPSRRSPQHGWRNRGTRTGSSGGRRSSDRCDANESCWRRT